MPRTRLLDRPTVRPVIHPTRPVLPPVDSQPSPNHHGGYCCFSDRFRITTDMSMTRTSTSRTDTMVLQPHTGKDTKTTARPKAGGCRIPRQTYFCRCKSLLAATVVTLLPTIPPSWWQWLLRSWLPLLALAVGTASTAANRARHAAAAMAAACTTVNRLPPARPRRWQRRPPSSSDVWGMDLGCCDPRIPLAKPRVTMAATSLAVAPILTVAAAAVLALAPSALCST